MELSRFRKKDIPVVLSWVRSEAQMVQWAGPIFRWPLTRSQFTRHLEAAKPASPSLYPFGLYDGSKIAGYGELFGYNRRAESAIISRVLVAPRRRNRGHGRFLIAGLLEFGFSELGLNRIALGVFDFNEPAIRCYQTAGFLFEGTLRQSFKVNGAYWNCHLMSILRTEWTARYKEQIYNEDQ